MITFYSILIVLCVYLEVSTKIDTHNILNKLGIGLVIVGALLGIYSQYKPLAQPNYLIAFGVFLHFICEVLQVRKRNHRRAGDRKTT